MIANEYLVGFRAHFSYWTSRDLMWHILRRMESITDETNLGSTKPVATTESPRSAAEEPSHSQEVAVVDEEGHAEIVGVA